MKKQITVINTEHSLLSNTLRAEIKKRSDRLMDYFLFCFFSMGCILANFYDTWSIALIVGSICLAAYYSVKFILPGSILYQYVLSAVLGVFMAQFIYQMHGLLEMHFFAFIGSAILITYQNWKLQIPLVVLVVVHHATLGYLQNSGIAEIYFTQLDYFELRTFIIHILLASIIFFICGLWSYQLKKYSEIQISQTMETMQLQKEALLHLERIKNEEALKEAYMQAEKAREDAVQASKAKSTFLATMSHEIRTPMNGVIGTTSLLAECELSQEQKRYVDIIRTSGESLLTVINDILDFSKIESEKLELEQEPFELRTIVEEVLDLFAGKAEEAGLDLIYQIDYNVPPHIYGDSVRLKQILLNLTGNAIKFTKKGEILIRVKLEEEKNGNTRLGFEIRDTGIGIPENKIDTLFEAFTQVDSSTTRKYGGSGLGLVICKRLVELMGGNISIQSVMGRGTCFHFSIITRPCMEQVLSYVYTSTTHLENKRILIVDDNKTNLEILKDQLENWKFFAVTALSAEEAMEILKKESFELVISDMQMPEIDGTQLATHIKQSYPQLPVILLSSMGDLRNNKNAHLFCSVLAKPIKQKELHQAIIQSFKQGKTNLPQNDFAEKPKITADFAGIYPMKILIAEDNLVNQTLIKTVMKKLGYQPEIVDNGIKVLETLNENQYDLVLMDVQMPEMDGLEATKLIRGQLHYQPVIIAVTANAMQDDRQACLSTGMDDYISKPLQLEKLVTLLEKWGSKIKLEKAA